jgi:hypothetical protein
MGSVENLNPVTRPSNWKRAAISHQKPKAPLGSRLQGSRIQLPAQMKKKAGLSQEEFENIG